MFTPSSLYSPAQAHSQAHAQSHCLNPHCRAPHNPFGRDRCPDCTADLLLGGRFRLGTRLHTNPNTHTSLTLVTDEGMEGHPQRLLKVLHRSCPQWEQQFQREAQLLQRLSQPIFCTAPTGAQALVPRSLPDDWLEFDWDSGIQAPMGYVMDYLPGRSLAEELQAHGGSIPWTRLRVWLPQLIQLVNFLHHHQIVHGDIKPDNIIVTQAPLSQDRLSQDRLQLIDFGAAGNVGDRSFIDQSSAGFCPKSMVGEPLAYQRDWYALGWTCIQLLTGYHPLDFPRPGEANTLSAEGIAIDWHHLIPQLNPALEQRMNSWLMV